MKHGGCDNNNNEIEVYLYLKLIHFNKYKVF